MAGELRGKVAVVTGAASGIGLASSQAMLTAGARVVLVDRDEAALASICGQHGNAAIPLVVDLLDSAACVTDRRNRAGDGRPNEATQSSPETQFRMVSRMRFFA